MSTARIKIAAAALAVAAGSTIAVLTPAEPAVAAESRYCLEWKWNGVDHYFCFRYSTTP